MKILKNIKNKNNYKKRKLKHNTSILIIYNQKITDMKKHFKSEIT